MPERREGREVQARRIGRKSHVRMVLHPQKKNVKKNTRAQGKKVKFFSPPKVVCLIKKCQFAIFSVVFLRLNKKKIISQFILQME